MSARRPKAKTEKLRLHAKPHNGTPVTYVDPETGVTHCCQLEQERLEPGRIPQLNGAPLPLKPWVPDAEDSAEDAGWYYEEETNQWVNRIGGQRLLIEMSLVYKRLCAPVGRRWGKTTALFWMVLTHAIRTPGKFYGLIIEPTHDKAYELMEKFIEFWGGKPGEKDPETGKKRRTMISRVAGGPKDQRRFIEINRPLTGDLAVGDNFQQNKGLRLYFVSGKEPGAIRGYPHPMHLVVVDEMSLSHPTLWPVVNHMLADSNGHAVFLGTTDEDEPGNDLFHTFYLWGLDSSYKRRNWASMNFPSVGNPHLSPEGLEEVENACITEQDRLQEVYARFLTGRGAVFSNLPRIFTLPFITGDALPEWVMKIQAEGLKALGKADDLSIRAPQVWLFRGYEKGHSYAISSDWAKDRDHTILTILNLTTMKQVLIARFYGQNWPEQYVWAARLYEHYGCILWHGDENTGAGQAIGDLMRRRHGKGIHPHKFNVHNKGAYVTRLQTAFLEQQLKLINCYEQYEEFKSYKRFAPDDAKGQKLIRYGHPPGKNDDFVDAVLQLAETVNAGEIPVYTTAEPEAKWENKDGEFKVKAKFLMPDLSEVTDYSGMY